MGSLLEGIDVPTGRAAGAAKPSDQKKGLKLSIALLCFAIAGGLIWWNLRPRGLEATVEPSLVDTPSAAGQPVSPLNNPTPATGRTGALRPQ